MGPQVALRIFAGENLEKGIKICQNIGAVQRSGLRGVCLT